MNNKGTINKNNQQSFFDFDKKEEVKSIVKKNSTIRLSPTTGFGLFRDCPRCFWLHYNKGVHRPRGIFPSLPGGMDLVIKDYFDNYRGGLPPELEGKVKGYLMKDNALLNTWRNWRTGLEYHDKEINATLFGALDDCMRINEQYVPLDYKTRGSKPNDGDSEKYYQTQLDTYGLLLEANGYPSANYGYLVYYYPEKVSRDGMVKFNVKSVELNVNIERVKKLFVEAVKTLRGPLPKKHSACEYCNWGYNLAEFD